MESFVMEGGAVSRVTEVQKSHDGDDGDGGGEDDGGDGGSDGDGGDGSQLLLGTLTVPLACA